MKEWFWDRNINSKKLKKILSSAEHPDFIRYASLILSRENIPRKIFKYISKEDFVRNWNKIKKQMRKNQWNNSRVIFWQAIYEKLLERFRKKNLKLKTKDTKVVNQLCVQVGQKIKELRIKKELTQQELAKKVGISQQMLSRIECGKENITLETLNKIVEKFNAELVVEIKQVN